MKNQLTYKPFGEGAILIEWPAKMKDDILQEIISFKEIILKKRISGVIEVIQSINSITLIFDHHMVAYDEIHSSLLNLQSTKTSVSSRDSDLWKIPVCYDESFGVDLAELSSQKGLSKDEIIELHYQQKYRVFSIGFLPGFLYLGGLNERIYSPRRAEPRLNILKGAVGIGGQQTGIYPTESPGGWQIIGNTPIPLFEINEDIPCFAKPGDKIQFTPISMNDHKLITQLISLGEYKLEQEVIHD